MCSADKTQSSGVLITFAAATVRRLLCGRLALLHTHLLSPAAAGELTTVCCARAMRDNRMQLYEAKGSVCPMPEQM